MNLFKRIVNNLCIVALVVCCAALLLFGWSATGWKALIVPTGSMRPSIPLGSLVLVHRVPTSSLKVGDVITYINPLNTRATISHRIIKKYMIDGKIQGYVTKGDSNKIADIPISAGSVKGKVVWHVPSIGSWLLKIKKPTIVLPIVYMAGLLVMIEEVIRLRDYYKLSQPYRLRSCDVLTKQKGLLKKVKYSTGLVILLLAIAITNGPVAQALLKSNVVSLTDNTISVGSDNECTGNTNNNTSVTINNNNSQTANSGNTSSAGGNASSGNASNNSSTNINVNVTNC